MSILTSQHLPTSGRWSNALSSLRMGILYFAVLSTSLGTALSAIGRFALYVMAIGVWILAKQSEPKRRADLMHTSAAFTVLVAVAYMALSVLWSEASVREAVSAWARHARLLSIPIVCLLIYSYAEARSVLRVFAWGQIFVVFSSWLLVAGIPVPWATSKWVAPNYAVFGSYLEQAISQAVLVAIVWHQRDWILGAKGRWWAVAVAATTLVHTLGFLIGRSGHLVAIALVAIAVMYELPKRFRWATMAVPFLVFALAFTGFKTFRDRIELVRTEASDFTSKDNAATSSGQRLLYWRVALLAVQEQPILGHGAGSWNAQYRRLEAGKADRSSLGVTDPHQLFLLWAVEGGAVGLLLLCAVLGELYVRSRKLPVNDARTLQSVIAALIVSGMLNSMIFGIGMGDFFCVALGLCLALVHGNEPVLEPTNHG